MVVLDTNLEGVFVLEPKVFGDNRGYFYEVKYHCFSLEGGATNSKSIRSK